MWLVLLGIVAVTGVVILLEKSASADVIPSNSSLEVPVNVSGGDISIPQADGNSIDLPCGFHIMDANKTRYSAAEITWFALNAGFDENNVIEAVAVALAESSGNPNAYNPETAANTPVGLGSYGLWQIYRKAHPEFNLMDLRDPQVNANAAYKVYRDAGNSFKPWSTYKNNAYSAKLNEAQQGYDAVSV